MFNKNSVEGEKFIIAVSDANNIINIKNNFIKYFEQLDKYKIGQKNELTQQEIDLINMNGFESYCNMMIDKFCVYAEKFDTIISYILYELNIKITDNEIKQGINIQKYIN